MLITATPDRSDFVADASLGELLQILRPLGEQTLAIEYGDRRVQAGYHVTEVKAGSFATLDCGGNPDGWHETILQIEDIPLAGDARTMTAAKFCTILDRVAARIDLVGESRLTVEIGAPGEPMQVFDVGEVRVEDGQALLGLAARPAICKPRHRAASRSPEEAACCGPATAKPRCCG